MKSSEGNYEKTMKALKLAHGEKTNIEVGGSWQIKVMNQIRRLGPLTPEADEEPIPLFEGASWRFSVATCIALIFLLTYAVIDTERKIAQSLYDDPVALVITDQFNID